MKNFLISYNGKDKQWAEWIAWVLEETGYTTVIQAWDFRAGGDFVLEMQKAATDTEFTIAVLSDNDEPLNTLSRNGQVPSPVTPRVTAERSCRFELLAAKSRGYYRLESTSTLLGFPNLNTPETPRVARKAW